LIVRQTTFPITVMLALLASCGEPHELIAFRDLNKNGKLDVYEDVTQTGDARIDDLLSQMSVADKAGLMFINIAIVNDDASLEYIPGSGPERWAPLPNVDEQKLSHFNVGRIPDDPADSESPLFENGFGLAYY
jgi:beta-glucosidase